MKTQDFQKPLLVIAAVSVLFFLAGDAVAQDSTASTAAPLASVQTAPQLSYGVSQIVQLAQAKVGDSTIIAYIQNSGNSYGLNAGQIIYLRQQGVSDGVINVMLNQRNNNSPQQNSSDTSAQTSTAMAQPTVTYVQTIPSSSVYVIPDTQTYNYNAWYYSQPYYYPYYAWPYPAVSLSFGFGGRWGGGYYHGGGWHGGGHGGWHH
ncbi:MAG TPA: hypothetical protein VGM58_03805 [Verrucomicrobiae bacterium]|jgi:hypothetical protein